MSKGRKTILWRNPFSPNLSYSIQNLTGFYMELDNMALKCIWRALVN